MNKFDKKSHNFIHILPTRFIVRIILSTIKVPRINTTPLCKNLSRQHSHKDDGHRLSQSSWSNANAPKAFAIVVDDVPLADEAMHAAADVAETNRRLVACSTQACRRIFADDLILFANEFHVRKMRQSACHDVEGVHEPKQR